jgi:hypothetical protein
MPTVELEEDFDAELDSESAKTWAVHRKPKPAAGWIWLLPILFWAPFMVFAIWGLNHGNP